MTPRHAPHHLRASDTDRERVVTLLAEAAGDGRLTLAEHAERTGRAYAARTLGELAELTADLAPPSAQPIRLDGHRPVTGLLRRERRDGRWIVPEHLGVTAVLGEVVLDLREALLQTPRVTVHALMLAGRLQLIVPAPIAVVATASAMLSRTAGASLTMPGPGTPVVEIRSYGCGGQIRVIRPRPRKRRGFWSRLTVAAGPGAAAAAMLAGLPGECC